VIVIVFLRILEVGFFVFGQFFTGCLRVLGQLLPGRFLINALMLRSVERQLKLTPSDNCGTFPRQSFFANTTAGKSRIGCVGNE